MVNSFNPRPGLSTRATSSVVPSKSHAIVSIRAQVFRPGRLRVLACFSQFFPCFNPRPGLSTRATSGRLQPAPATACFNPRPGLSTRATHLQPGRGIRVLVSIRAQVFRPGRPIMSVQFITGKPVSIRAQVFRPGRQALARQNQALQLFQSAPRSFDPGDLLIYWEP